MDTLINFNDTENSQEFPEGWQKAVSSTFYSILKTIKFFLLRIKIGSRTYLDSHSSQYNSKILFQKYICLILQIKFVYRPTVFRLPNKYFINRLLRLTNQ